MAQELAEQQDGRRHRRPRPGCSAALGGLGPARAVSTSYAPPVQRLVTELSKLPGRRQPHRPAAGVPHPARLRRGRGRAGRGDPSRSRRGSACARCASTSPTRPAAASARTAPRPRADLRRRGAQRRDPDGAHARVPRRLPRARRRAVADRRRRPRGPEDRRAARPRARGRPPAARRPACARSCWRPTRPRPARPPRCTSPRSCAPARPSVTVTRLASGLPVGSDLEYADEVTLGKAFAGRRALCECLGPRMPRHAQSDRVMKFGGTSVADAERIKRAARRIVEKREARHAVVAVLSARGKTTDELIAMAEEVSDRARPARDGHAALLRASGSPARCARWRSTTSATARSR